MAEQQYKTHRDLVIAGKALTEGQTFKSDPEAVRVALARGWIEKPKRNTKEAKG